MHKQRKLKGKPKSRFNFEEFCSFCVDDLADSIGPDLAGRLLFLLRSNPKEFRHVIDTELRFAESSLAEGGATRYIALRQLAAFLKKNADWNAIPKDERREASLHKFSFYENKCGLTNFRLSYLREHWSQQPIAGEVLNQASLRIQEILGSLDLALDSIHRSARFGSGATFRHTMNERSAYFKLNGHHTVTREAIPSLLSYLDDSDNLRDYLLHHKVEIVEGNRLAVVPKYWDIDRVIAIEPSWNVYLQLGVEGYLRDVLTKVGIDLRKQDRNFGPAREGSISGKYATIDLSSASDCLSIELVRSLLPKPWFELLDQIRSKSFTLDKGETWTRYEKFSSMGNGFTFPLQTLIFYAIAEAVATLCGVRSSSIRVYGDDIIIDRQCYALMVETLSYAGFEVNTQKSYCFGPFRESCGRDYLQGINVRPIYLRGRPSNDSDIYNLYNRLLVGSLVPLPRTLGYLRKCAIRDLTGPCHLEAGNSEVAVAIAGKPSSWRPGKALEFDRYFFDWSNEDLRSYSRDFQCYLYRIPILVKEWSLFKGTLDPLTQYFTFLYGIEGGIVYSSTKLKTRLRYRNISSWPDLRDVTRRMVDFRASG